jgi:hypothetical protein
MNLGLLLALLGSLLRHFLPWATALLAGMGIQVSPDASPWLTLALAIAVYVAMQAISFYRQWQKNKRVMGAEPFWKDVAAWVGAGLVAFVAWLARWAWGKLDGKASREELRQHIDEDGERFERMAMEAREGRHALRNDVAAAQAAQTVLNLEIKSQLGNVTGQLEQLTEAVREIGRR